MPPTSYLSCPMARLRRQSRRMTALSCIRRQRKAPLHWLPKKALRRATELTFQVIDKEKAEQERIAAEKKAEEERIAAEKKAEEERLAAEKAEQERIAARQQSQAQSQNSATVYVTPTGKKYHYNSSCNGGSYSPTTLDNAIKMGLTPCKKCVG